MNDGDARPGDTDRPTHRHRSWVWPVRRLWLVATPCVVVATLTACQSSSPSAPGTGSAAPSSIVTPTVETPASVTPTRSPGALTATEKRFGLPKDPNSGRPYLSGVWLGGQANVDALDQFQAWRKAPVETITTYVGYSTWADMRDNWTIGTFNDHAGTLIYGLALLPTEDVGTITDVANGEYDDVFQHVAANLASAGRDRTIVRVGLEANGTWFRWGATQDTAADFQKAFRRVAAILKDNVPGVIVDFDIGCGVGLTGNPDPLAPLTMLYPGDDVVDVIGCDTYDDRHVSLSNGPDGLGRTGKGPSLLDVLTFAKAHHKPMSIPEWGLDRVYGSGDNPLYIFTMHQFLQKHGGDVLFENYFNEPGTTLKSSLWLDVQNPQSAQTYLQLWASPGG